MLYNVSGLIQEGMGANRIFEIDEPVEVEGRQVGRAAGTVEFIRTKNGILVRACLQLAEPEACSRCLKPLEQALRIDFEEEFQTVTDPVMGESDDDLDPDAFLVDEHNQLDLTEAIRQYREVSLEIAPLCRPDCLGLCPQCGGDLNLKACGCEKNAVDSRWEKLATLVDVLSEGME